MSEAVAEKPRYRRCLLREAEIEKIRSREQTRIRRPLKAMPSQKWLKPETLLAVPKASACMIEGEQWAQLEHPKGGPLGCVPCQFGKPGDRLWVPETWGIGSYPVTGDEDRLVFKADEPEWTNLAGFRWRSAASMSRHDARTVLEIVRVEVQRVQSMEGWDVVKEGLDHPDWHRRYDNSDGDFLDEDRPLEAYRDLWEEIYGKDAWKADPWTWFADVRLL